MSNTCLLPINRTPLETKLCDMHLFDPLAVDVQDVNNPQKTPDNFLPHLAWALSVDYFSDKWTSEQKRQSIQNSFSVHSIKGTPASIRAVLKNAGYGDIDIIEGNGGVYYDGTYRYDGTRIYGEYAHWATYLIKLKKPITNTQAAEIREILQRTQPARCHLRGFIYEEAQFLYDGTITYDGLYSYGATE